METKVIQLTIALEIDADADPQEVADELDYDINHPSIVSTEIRELEYDCEDEECFVLCPNCKTRHNLTHMMWTIMPCTECGVNIENKLFDDEE